MKKTFFILFVAFLYCTNGAAAQNGYSLEFEDVVMLSVDTAVATGSVFLVSQTWNKSFTVPANMVLKINAGHLQGQDKTTQFGIYPWAYSYLDIGGEKICANMTSDPSKDNYSTFSNEYSIWVPSGKTVRLTAVTTAYCGGYAALPLGWVSGVLFRKVPN
jgi:hypothetical protein